ncbi:MAG: bacteriophage Gp15 family protein [Clostridia bacterium]|nr:bacteriophage Gp15 family protein [Clostridia bacterium]
MNLFTEKFPNVISVDGAEIPINTDFRVWVQVEQVFSASAHMSVETILSLYRLVFPKDTVIPENVGKTLEQLLWFYGCETRAKKGGARSSSKNRIVSFLEDSALIYAAFLSQYHIDLTETDMHWWKFRALFDGLWSNHRISEVMGYRGEDLSKIKDKERRKFYKDMQERYKLPDLRSEAEIERDNMANLEKMI